uniref:Uncharacterized protein n=1 Tax=Anguilla anguilla TaxID=7936 RepID=A0A0E9RW38_ANGAN
MCRRPLGIITTIRFAISNWALSLVFFPSLAKPLWGVTFVPKNWEACSCLTGPKYFPSALD